MLYMSISWAYARGEYKIVKRLLHPPPKPGFHGGAEGSHFPGNAAVPAAKVALALTSALSYDPLN